LREAEKEGLIKEKDKKGPADLTCTASVNLSSGKMLGRSWGGANGTQKRCALTCTEERGSGNKQRTGQRGRRRDYEFL